MSWEDEVTTMDIAVDGGTASFDDETRVLTIALGPVISCYASLETSFERYLYRGLMEGFGIMRAQSNL